MEFIEKMVALGVSADAATTYRDIYEIGPWGNDAQRDAWSVGLSGFIDVLSAAKPADEVRTILELQAKRLRALVTGDEASHQAALDGLASFFAAHI